MPSYCREFGSKYRTNGTIQRWDVPVAVEKEYLGLSDAQVSEIIRVNVDYRDFVAPNEARIGQLQAEIATAAMGRQ